MNPAQHYLTSAPPEEAYDRLTGYAFARRYVVDRSVADVQPENAGPGVHLLAEVAGSVTGLISSGEAAERASLRTAPNASYESVDLPALSQPDGGFDVVVALQVIEHLESPEDLIREAKRVLKPDGVLIVSTPDKQVRSNERNHQPRPSEMYVQEFQGLLESHFENVSVRRQGAVAGGFVSGASDGLGETPLESVQLSSLEPSPGSGMPPTSLVVAVCSDAEIPEEDGSPYLLLDRDRRVFEEDEDHREDVELLRDEVRRMQETEVQSFQNTLALRTSEVTYLRSELGLSDGRSGPGASPDRVQELKDQNDALRRENDKIKHRLHGIEGSNIWRLTAPYRRGRTLLDSWMKRGSGGDSNGR